MAAAPPRSLILRTKLHPPRLTDDILVRERLLARLSYAAALNLVVAPAGYGKTTLAATWLARSSWPGAWLTLDATDNNFSVFLAGLVAAVRSISPGFGADVLELVGAPLELTADLVLPTLLNALLRLGHDFVLVLDDFHTITAPAVHQVLTGIVTYAPALHLLLCTRHDPPLPPRLRASGYVNEVRMHELSFSAEETADFLERAAPHRFAAETIATLLQQVEGWPVALRLLAIMAQQGREFGPIDTAVRASGRQLMDYLAAEVVDCLPADLQRFLEYTAILQRLHGSLCTAVLGEDENGATQNISATERGAAVEQGAAQTLQRLEQAGLFLVAIDEAGDWYRYHALFRALMQERLIRRAGMPPVEELHRRAAAWYESQAMLDEALHHLLALADKTAAVAFVGRYWPQVLLQTDFRRLEQWVSLFAPAVVQSSPDLLLIQAWLSQYYYDIPALAACCRRAEEIALQACDAAQRREWLGHAKALTAVRLMLIQDAQGAIDTARQALALLPPNFFYTRSAACVAQAAGLQMAGQPEALHDFLESLRREPGLPRDLIVIRNEHVAGYAWYVAGDLPALRAAGLQVVAAAEPREMAATKGWGHYFAGCACYLQNDLAGAYEHFGLLVERRYRFAPLSAAHGAFGLALTFQALNLPQQANAVLEDAQRYLAQLRGRGLFQMSEALAAELAWRQGCLDEAVRWRRQQSASLPPDTLLLLYSTQLAQVKILLAEDTVATRREAAYVLHDFLAKVDILHNVRFQIEAQVQLAQLRRLEGDMAAALAALGQALAAAEPGGHIRVFLDPAPSLGPLLAAYQPPPALAAFTARVRSAVEQSDEFTLPAATQAAQSRAEWPKSAPASAAPPDRDLRELLTFREMDVLLLLSRRMTNKEIARELGISVETVKQHTVNLYRKLGVDNRRQAIMYAAKIEGAVMDGARRE